MQASTVDLITKINVYITLRKMFILKTSNTLKKIIKKRKKKN